MDIKRIIVIVLIISIVVLVLIPLKYAHYTKAWIIIDLIIGHTLLFILMYAFKKLKKNVNENNGKNKANEIEQLKMQLKIQEEEIIHQIRFLKEQGNQIEKQKKDLDDSISYAFRIQQAILPSNYYINQLLQEYFILYLPKSIVSGDFYYVEQVKDYVIVAAVDCTGHGVPGAMMSILGYDLLNQAVKINQITKPSDILSFINNGLLKFLRQKNSESGINDGMDISIISIHKFHKLVEFAGAYHELYYTHYGKIMEIKGDKLPIGINFDGTVDLYTNHAIPVSKGDMLYLFSDGYANQFGGPYGKKIKYKQLKQLLWDISTKNTIEQKEILLSTFLEWKGENEQVDDVLLLGIRI